MPTSLPPGPSLPPLLQTAFLAANTAGFLKSCRRRYGDVFTIQLRSMGLEVPGPIVYVADTAAIREVFTMDGTAGHAGIANSELKPVTGLNSILLLDEDSHLAERRLLSPAFHGNALRHLEAVVEEAVQAELGRWSPDEVFAMRPAMQRITFEVITRAVFGVDDPALRERLLEAFEPVFNVSAPTLVPALRIDLGKWSPWGRLQRAIDHLDNVLFELIEEGRKVEGREDILGMLLSARDEDGNPLSPWHIRDELVTLLLAGHETTATALSWSLERLAHHPEVVTRAREAIAQGGDAYLDAVAAETLRVRPVVMGVARRLSEEVEIAGFQLPKGATVLPSIYLVHFDGENFDEANEFRPERFGGKPPSRDTWLPFGGGRRRCIGAAFAQMEMRIVLGAILSEFVPEPVAKQPEKPRRRGITIAPEHGARLRMRRSPIDLDPTDDAGSHPAQFAA